MLVQALSERDDWAKAAKKTKNVAATAVGEVAENPEAAAANVRNVRIIRYDVYCHARDRGTEVDSGVPAAGAPQTPQGGIRRAGQGWQRLWLAACSLRLALQQAAFNLRLALQQVTDKLASSFGKTGSFSVLVEAADQTRTEFKVSSVILSSWSEVFDKMMNHDFKEHTQRQVVIKDFLAWRHSCTSCTLALWKSTCKHLWRSW
ncbi:unnamed protein product [Durusdinium trenchii]|uniref:BTB domain-containing protein n=1 Tax=Durusdinium trenchii TaxID=1381693 RepID=A0ABP0SW28_9DINO